MSQIYIGIDGAAKNAGAAVIDCSNRRPRFLRGIEFIGEHEGDAHAALQNLILNVSRHDVLGGIGPDWSAAIEQHAVFTRRGSDGKGHTNPVTTGEMMQADGIICGCWYALIGRAPVRLKPTEWRKEYGRKPRGFWSNKKNALELAHQIFNHEFKDHNIAEAALIAYALHLREKRAAVWAKAKKGGGE